MITVRQIERLWQARGYERLLEQLLAPRPETSDQLLSQLTGQLPAAAVAIIRLDELAQPFAKIYGELVRTLLSAQRPDGGWGDTMTTALCLRALLCGNSHGESIDRGLVFLANLQKTDGIWPAIPVQRMPADPFASAFVLCRLIDTPRFHQAVNVDLAFEWFEANEMALDQQTRRLWAQAKRRLPAKPGATRSPTQAVAAAKSSFWDFSPALTA